jgi:acetylornithine deacetylase
LAAYPGLETSREHPAVTAALRWSEQDTCNVAFGTEAGFFADLNIPTVVCGPGSMSGQGHKEDEYISRSQLLACSQMLGKALESIQ